MTSIHQQVKDYYENTLTSSKDLKTNACCTPSSVDPVHQSLLDKIIPDVSNTYYGCGVLLPAELNGKTVLDLGCGSGRDVYLLSQCVGPEGQVIGVDMTDGQLDIARQSILPQMKAFGFKEPNVRFLKGYIEDLHECGISSQSIDVVISNCVINLSPQKQSVFNEIYRILKPGGELYFSDIFVNRRISELLQQDPVLYGECLSGAIYSNDLRRLLRLAGFLDFNYVSQRNLAINSPEISKVLSDYAFTSSVVRAFKLELEDDQEDYGQVGIYQGTIDHYRDQFIWDQNTTFKTKQPTPISGNLARILTKSRFSPHFKIEGSQNVHYGPFKIQNKTKGKSSCC
ncbi:methyltransferase type 11 [Candidatus Marinamargulisbacteria bacterium SCGC AG-410-N11]|nr:methyltransferase type 11 [Candidatus Marinamargulisbacteria bacterium SCGC AG-410-N11]